MFKAWFRMAAYAAHTGVDRLVPPYVRPVGHPPASASHSVGPDDGVGKGGDVGHRSRRALIKPLW